MSKSPRRATAKNKKDGLALLGVERDVSCTLMQCVEVAMEKYQSPSLPKRKPRQAVNSSTYSPPPPKDRPAEVTDKFVREEVARLIHIWDAFYRQGDDKLEPRELCLPPAPWRD